jgi:hypothetical protein
MSCGWSSGALWRRARDRRSSHVVRRAFAECRYAASDEPCAADQWCALAPGARSCDPRTWSVARSQSAGTRIAYRYRYATGRWPYGRSLSFPARVGGYGSGRILDHDLVLMTTSRCSGRSCAWEQVIDGVAAEVAPVSPALSQHQSFSSSGRGGMGWMLLPKMSELLDIVRPGGLCRGLLQESCCLPKKFVRKCLRTYVRVGSLESVDRTAAGLELRLAFLFICSLGRGLGWCNFLMWLMI